MPLPQNGSATISPGNVIVQPTLYWSGDGDWTTGQWQLADGTPTPWIDGSGVVLAAGSNINISGLVNVSAINVPSSSDMHQGALGDCYFIAALGALADSSPAAIESMFIPNGVENGIQSWTVRFYYDSARGYVADYVTVNAMLPIDLAGNLGFAGAGTSGSLWMPLLEKAYSQWNETGREGRDGRNSYTSLNGGWMQNVDSQVLGLAPTTLSPGGGPGHEAGPDRRAAKQRGGDGGDFSEFNALGLVSGHAYQV